MDYLAISMMFYYFQTLGISVLRSMHGISQFYSPQNLFSDLAEAVTKILSRSGMIT